MSMPPSTLPPKREVALALLERGSLFVHLDPRVEGVVVPDYLRSQPQLVLQVGLGLAVPIPDLEVDDEGVFGTLSFNRSPFYCRVPWASVFGLVGDDGMGLVWQEELPTELADDVQAAAEKAERAARGPKLRSVDGGGEDAPAEPRGDEPTAPAKRPKLRLVK
ncbi:MAG: hypothetical protein KC619_03475 [Myxococcales bacterium]|nr:hypothetical protein [Myxococcales bacterium]